MSRRKKNAGHGYGMDFHGAFSSKADAKKKERKVHGFIRPTNIKGERRYVVMSERKNPRPHRKKKNPVLFDAQLGAYSAWERTKKWGTVYGHGKTQREAVHDLNERLASYKAGDKPGAMKGYGGENPMDLVVMGANPGKQSETREVIVHPGQTITLRVNPTAAEIREEFTGREYDEVFVSTEPHMRTGNYAQLGQLMGISYKPVRGGQVQAIGWYEGAETMPLEEAAKSLRKLTDAPVLVSDEGRRQLYFVGGTQDLSPLGWEELGEARTIVYRERKSFDDFTLMNYVHHFGEETGERPTLFYDAQKNRLLLQGGAYQVRPEGIVN